jgi:hypothetical protein
MLRMLPPKPEGRRGPLDVQEIGCGTLADKIELEPVGSGRQRGYKFRGALSLERLIAGDAMNNPSDYGGPNGIRTRV